MPPVCIRAQPHAAQIREESVRNHNVRSLPVFAYPKSIVRTLIFGEKNHVPSSGIPPDFNLMLRRLFWYFYLQIFLYCDYNYFICNKTK